MTVPCMLGLRCPHMIPDGCGDPVCCHPFTPETMDEEEWAEERGLCMDMTSMDCPLIEDGSDLEYLIRSSDEYGMEQWAALMSMLRVAVHRCDRANVGLDAMREEMVADTFGRWMEVRHEEYERRRSGVLP